MSTRHLAPVAQYREPRNSSAASVITRAYVAEVSTGVFALTTVAGSATHVLDNATPGVLEITAIADATSPARFTYQGGGYLAYGIT